MKLPSFDMVDDETDVLAMLVGIVGAPNVLSGEAGRGFFTDVYRAGMTPLAVLRPTSVEQLAAVVGAATAAGVAVVPRGGGASYTDGYLPASARSIIIDTTALDRILDINEADGYVTVEAGVTWAALRTALGERGLRTPFWGPFSGLVATIGGSASQNSISHGSAAHGISAQSILSMDVVTASGDILCTGSAGREGVAPFMRFDGPDLTGVFTGDCGALGVKARVTLRLLKSKPAFLAASFAFGTLEAMASSMRDGALEELDDSSFALDRALSQGQIARQSTGSAKWQLAVSVMRSSPSLGAGLRQLARMASAGTRALQSAEYILHVIVEGVDRHETRAKLNRLRELMTLRGREIPNSVPVVVRGMPFAPLYNVLGPKGERWVPVHGILAHHAVPGFHHAVQALFERRAAAMQRHGVWVGTMFSTVGSSGFLYEIAFYWPGAHSAFHTLMLPAEHLSSIPAYADDPAATSFVDALKQEVLGLYDAHGATHFQIGKAYRYASMLKPPTLRLLKSIKAQVDPDNLMNPGCLDIPMNDS